MKSNRFLRNGWLTLLLVAGAACERQSTSVNSAPSDSAPPTSAAAPPSETGTGSAGAATHEPAADAEPSVRTPVKRVHARNVSKLMAIDGVVGVGIGRTASGKDALVVMVKHASVKPRIPKQIESFPVEVVVTGEVKPEGSLE